MTPSGHHWRVAWTDHQRPGRRGWVGNTPIPRIDETGCRVDKWVCLDNGTPRMVAGPVIDFEGTPDGRADARREALYPCTQSTNHARATGLVSKKCKSLSKKSEIKSSLSFVASQTGGQWAADAAKANRTMPLGRPVRLWQWMS